MTTQEDVREGWERRFGNTEADTTVEAVSVQAEDNPDSVGEEGATDSVASEYVPVSDTRNERVYAWLRNNPGNHEAVDIAKALALPTVQVSSTLKRLKERGLITKPSRGLVKWSGGDYNASSGNTGKNMGYTDKIRAYFNSIPEGSVMTVDEIVDGAGVDRAQIYAAMQRLVDRKEYKRHGTGRYSKNAKFTGKVPQAKSREGKTYRCDLCGEMFSSYQAVGGHKSTSHKPGKAEPKDDLEIAPGDTFEVVGVVGNHVIARHVKTLELVEVRSFDIK